MRQKGQSRAVAPGAHAALAALAERQHGVVSIRQLRGPLAYSASAVTRAAADGRLHRLYRGVYAVGHARLTLQGRALAAVLACGRRALLSHGSAAWLWGVSTRSPLPFEVTVPSPRHSRRPFVLHYARGLLPSDRALQEGIPVTAVPRTLLDLAGSIRSDRLQRVIERAEELGLFDLGPIEALLTRSVGHPGIGRLRCALDLYRAPAFTRSGLERRFLALVEEAGLPAPSPGLNVAGYELDVYWPEHRFAVELDAFETHGSRAAFERDRLRDEDLKLAGVEIVRVTGRRLEREPRVVIERVARLLALQHRRPPGS
jgi:hypothetical protein